MTELPVRLTGPGRAALCWLLAVPVLYLHLRGQYYPAPARAAIVIGATGLVTVLHHRTRASFDGAIAITLASTWFALSQKERPGTAWVAVAITAASVLTTVVVRRKVDRDAPALGWTLATLAALAAACLAAVAAQHGMLAVRNTASLAIGLPIGLAVGTGATPRRWGHDPLGWPAALPALAGCVALGTHLGLAVSSALALLSLVLAGGSVLLGGSEHRLVATLRTVGRPFDRLLDRCDQAARGVVHLLKWLVHALSAVLLTVVWALVVLLPWAVRRVVRTRPLDPPVTAGTRWVRHEPRHANRTDRAWAPDDPSLAGRRALRRRRRGPRLVGLVAVLLVGASIGGLVSRANTKKGMEAAGPAHGAGQAPLGSHPTGKVVAEAVHNGQQALSDSQTVALYTGVELPTVKSPALNTGDRQRKTWQPDIDRCAPRVVVWAFGGSAFFGIGQRDDHTIPSQLAKAAAARGVDLEVHNFSVPGDVAFQQYHRLQRELALRSDRPDLVVFYDGFNDLLAHRMASQEDEARAPLRGLLDSEVLPLVTKIQQEARLGRPPLFTLHTTLPKGTPVSPDESVRLGLRQYRLASSWTRDLLGREHIRFVQYYQPSLATRARIAKGDPDVNQEQIDTVGAFREGLPPGVVDLGNAVDRDPTSVYIDEVHMDERGANDVAVAMWSDLSKRVDVERLSRKPASCR